MTKVLKNPLRQNIKTIFRGKELIFRSKAGIAFDMEDEEKSAEFYHWKNIYGFLYEPSL